MADKHYEQWLADFPQSSSSSDSDSDDEEDESVIEIAAACWISKKMHQQNPPLFLMIAEYK
jgi:hypothetical protein